MPIKYIDLIFNWKIYSISKNIDQGFTKYLLIKKNNEGVGIYLFWKYWLHIWKINHEFQKSLKPLTLHSHNIAYWSEAWH